MARDYKHRAERRDAQKRQHKKKGSTGVSVLKWMLITGLLIGFAVFLVYLKSPAFQQSASGQIAQQKGTVKAKTTLSDNKTGAKENAEPQKPPAPQFDFYTILPKKEVIVPDHEAKTRTREEQIGKNKKTSYVIQVGSSQDSKDADRLRAKLALMGIESKIQKAKVESATWYRVKIGPYTQMSSVNNVISRLQKNGMKPVITEIGE